MKETLQTLISIAPELAFFILLTIAIGWYLKHLSQQLIANFTAITTESRENFKAILEETRKGKEDLFTEIEYFKSQVLEYREENKELQEDILLLKQKIERLEKLTDAVRTKMAEGIDLMTKQSNELETHKSALFAERDRLEADIELAWKAIFKLYKPTATSVTKEQTSSLKSTVRQSEA